MMPQRTPYFRTLCLVFALGVCITNAVIGSRIQSSQGLLQTQVIPLFEAHNITRLDALIRLAQEKHIPLGIEGTDREFFSETVDFSTSDATLGAILAAIFKGSHGFVWSESNGVLSISKKFEQEGGGKNPLDRIIPEFRARTATVEELSNLLRMDVELLDNPQTHGFAGTFPAGEGRQLPPFDLRNRSVREVLNEIVRRYRDAAWISTDSFASPEKTRVGPTWTLIFYHDPPRPLSQLCCFSPR